MPHHHLPPRARSLVVACLGPTYWCDRARLTWLHAHLDLVTSDWFLAWCTTTRWAAWRARHPELGASTDTTAVPTALPRWTALPARLRAVLPTTLADARCALGAAATADVVERAAHLEAYAAQRTGWAAEAAALRRSVHGVHGLHGGHRANGRRPVWTRPV